MSVLTFRDLTVWRRSIELTRAIYGLGLPKEELFCLTTQMRRAAVSIASNIAEGKKRSTRKYFVHFLHIAEGSAAELETQLVITQEMYQHIDVKVALSLVDEVQKMLNALIVKLQPPRK